MTNSVNNNKTLDIYKDVAKKDNRTAYRAERNNKISSYGRKSHVANLIELFIKSNSGTSNYWLEVGE